MVLIMKKVLILSALIALTAASVGCNRESRQMSLFRGTCLGRMFNDECETCYGDGGYYEGDVYGGTCADGQCGGGMIDGGVYPGQIIDGGVLQGVPTYNGAPIIQGDVHPDLQATPTPALPGPAATTPEN